MAATDRYLEPGRVARLFNRIVAGLTRLGISVWGSRVLAVRGRSSGAWRTVPVNLLVVDGQRYLVAPRGVTQWVRNLRAAGGGELRVGRRVEVFTAEELADDDKPRRAAGVPAPVGVRGRGVLRRVWSDQLGRAAAGRGGRLSGVPDPLSGREVDRPEPAEAPQSRRPGHHTQRLTRRGVSINFRVPSGG